MAAIRTHRKNGSEIVFDSFETFHTIIRDKACPHFIYRGAPLFSYDLRPRIARKIAAPIGTSDWEAFYAEERTRFEIFKAKALSTSGRVASNDWEWLTLAQHYGVATRLLDWTENPLVALYFCALHTVDEKGHPANLDQDGVVYVCHPSEHHSADSNSPFDNKKHGLLYAPHLTQRLIAQAAVFTIHEKPWEEFNDTKHVIWKARVTKDFKAEIIKVLPLYGFSKRTMYTDLDSAGVELDSYMDRKICKTGKKYFIQST